MTSKSVYHIEYSLIRRIEKIKTLTCRFDRSEKSAEGTNRIRKTKTNRIINDSGLRKKALRKFTGMALRK